MDSQLIEGIPDYLRGYFEKASQFHYYLEYAKNAKDYRKVDGRFICLKGLASSTPIVSTAAFQNGSVGGGFYFRYHGLGVAVDPGIGFVSLMHQNQIFINDIDVVIVTHNHLDHNCDLPALASLLYDYNRANRKDFEFYEEFFPNIVFSKHKIRWILDGATKESAKDILDTDDVEFLSDYVTRSGQEILQNGSGRVFLNAVRTRHIKDCGETYGLRLRFSDKTGNVAWGYTSDTAYMDELADFFAGCDALILNISDVYVKDYLLIKKKHSHLGFKGCVHFLERVMPRLALISEFCCTNGDYRIEIVRALREKLHDKRTTIFPADRGLNTSICFADLECSACHAYAPLEDIRVANPGAEYAPLRYLCPKCLL